MQNKKLGKLSSLFCSSSGAYLPLLSEYPTQISKYYAMGVILWITCVMASFSGGYFITSIFSTTDGSFYPSFLGGLFGVFWGFVIFSIDRYMIISLNSNGSNNTKKYIVIVPRIILAIFLSFVIATPLELRIFKKSIAKEMNELHSIDLRNYLKSDTSLKINDKKITDYHQMLIDLKKAIENKEYEVSKLKKQYYDELNGEKSELGTGVRGNGPEAERKLLLWNETKVELQSLREGYIYDRKQTGEQINGLNEDSEQIKKNRSIAIQNSNGPLEQLKALSSLADAEPIVARASLFLQLLFILIELAPVLVKISMKESLYELALKSYEEEKKMELDNRNNFNKHKENLAFKKKKSDLHSEMIYKQKIQNKIWEKELELDASVVDNQMRKLLNTAMDDSVIKTKFREIETKVGVA